MGLVLIRRPSDTPTVDSFDDTRMLHYAVGGRRGITKNYGSECNLSASGNALTIGAGEIIVDGWQSVVDASGESVSVGGVPTGAYISVYAEFNMTAAESPIISIKTAYDTNDYPAISDGDDLISNPRGVARLVLWTCKKTASGVDTLTRVAEVISADVSPIAIYASTDKSKGTIEERLTELGFKQGSITLSDGSYTTMNKVTRYGKAVFVDLIVPNIKENKEISINGKLDKDFLPYKEGRYTLVPIADRGTQFPKLYTAVVTVRNDGSGSIGFAIPAQDTAVYATQIHFGFYRDAEPDSTTTTIREQKDVSFSQNIQSGGSATVEVEYSPVSELSDIIVASPDISISFYNKSASYSRALPTNDYAELDGLAAQIESKWASVSLFGKFEKGKVKIKIERKSAPTLLGEFVDDNTLVGSVKIDFWEAWGK